MRILAKRIGKQAGPDWREVIKEVERTLDKTVKPELLREFESVVENWEHKPGFAARKSIRGRDIEVSVYPTGKHKKIWQYVSEGTRPHKIRPRWAKALRFQWGGPGSYQPKTTVRPTTWGGPGTVSGGKTVYRQEVDHPGTEARNLEQFIGKRYQPKFVMHIQRAITQGLVNAWRGRIVRVRR